MFKDRFVKFKGRFVKFAINKRNDNSGMSAIRINSVGVSGRESICEKRKKTLTLSLPNNISKVYIVKLITIITRSDEMKMLVPAAVDQMSQ